MKSKLLLLLLVLPLLLAGCASSNLTVAPGTDLAKLKTFYVQKLPADNRGVDQLIVARLTALGFKATSGTSETPPAAVDAVVTYQDKWMWDITMYMLQLNVQVRDGSSRMVLANSQATRPSLQRKSPEGMVEEVLGKIFPQ